MSNYLSVRRVIIQTIDENGTPTCPQSFGVMAADDYGQAYNDTFESLAELNRAILDAGCILDIVSDIGEFAGFDRKQIGTDNFYGTIRCDNEDSIF